VSKNTAALCRYFATLFVNVWESGRGCLSAFNSLIAPIKLFTAPAVVGMHLIAVENCAERIKRKKVIYFTRSAQRENLYSPKADGAAVGPHV
jgi:hypothetical protein